MRNKPKDITGRRVGKLTAISLVGKEGVDYIWDCACECGNHINVKVRNLSKNRVTHCGCQTTQKSEYQYEEYVLPPPKMTNRKCRQCLSYLDESRWFNCLQCVPVLEDEDIWAESVYLHGALKSIARQRRHG